MLNNKIAQNADSSAIRNLMKMNDNRYLTCIMGCQAMKDKGVSYAIWFAKRHQNEEEQGKGQLL